MKKSCKFISIILVIITLMSVFSVFTISSSAAALTTTSTKTGYIMDSENKTVPIHIYTNGKEAKLRICTFNQAGQRTKGKLCIIYKSDNGGKEIKTVEGYNGILSKKSNFTLPKGNLHYEVYIIRNGGSFQNRTNTYYYSVDFIKNCYRLI